MLLQTHAKIGASVSVQKDPLLLPPKNSQDGKATETELKEPEQELSKSWNEHHRD